MAHLTSNSPLWEVPHAKNFNVVPRIKPACADGCEQVRVLGNQTVQITANVDGKQQAHAYDFAYAANPSCTQQEFYRVVGEHMVRDVLSGFNGNVLAYGSSGAGKSHTIMGGLEDWRELGSKAGLMPRMCHDIFAALRALNGQSSSAASSPTAEPPSRPSSAGSCRSEGSSCCAGQLAGGAGATAASWSAAVSAVQIYDGGITDLLKPGVRVAVGTDGTLYCKGQKDYSVSRPVQSEAEVRDYLHQAARSRVTAATRNNDESSRSHAIFLLQVTISQPQPDGTVLETSGTLRLVDLAGSERASAHEGLQPASAATPFNTKGAARAGRGRAQQETANINTSLLTLGIIMRGLANGVSREQLAGPFRSSALTCLLKDALGGNSKTVLIVNVHNDADKLDQIAASLQFADTATRIRNTAIRNTERKGDTAQLLGKLRQELKQAKLELQLKQDITDEAVAAALALEHQRQAQALESERQQQAEHSQRQERLVQHLRTDMAACQQRHASDLVAVHAQLRGLAEAVQCSDAVSQKQVQHAATLEQLRRAADLRTAHLQRQMRERQGSLEEAQQQAASTRAKLHAAQQQLQQQLSSLDEMGEHAAATRSELLATRQQLEEQLSSSGQAQQHHQSSLAEAQQEAVQAKAELLAAQQQLNALQSSLTQAQQQLQEQQSNSGQAQQQHESSVAHTQQEAAQAKAELLAAQQQLQEQQSSLAQAQQQHQSSLAEAQQEAVRAHAEGRAAQEQLHALQSSLEQAQQQGQEAQSQLLVVQQQLQQEMAAASAARQHAKDLQQQLSQLQMQRGLHKPAAAALVTQQLMDVAPSRLPEGSSYTDQQAHGALSAAGAHASHLSRDSSPAAAHAQPRAGWPAHWESSIDQTAAAAKQVEGIVLAHVRSACPQGGGHLTISLMDQHLRGKQLCGVAWAKYCQQLKRNKNRAEMVLDCEALMRAERAQQPAVPSSGGAGVALAPPSSRAAAAPESQFPRERGTAMACGAAAAALVSAAAFAGVSVAEAGTASPARGRQVPWAALHAVDVVDLTNGTAMLPPKQAAAAGPGALRSSPLLARISRPWGSPAPASATNEVELMQCQSPIKAAGAGCSPYASSGGGIGAHRPAAASPAAPSPYSPAGSTDGSGGAPSGTSWDKRAAAAPSQPVDLHPLSDQASHHGASTRLPPAARTSSDPGARAGGSGSEGGLRRRAGSGSCEPEDPFAAAGIAPSPHHSLADFNFQGAAVRQGGAGQLPPSIGLRSRIFRALM